MPKHRALRTAAAFTLALLALAAACGKNDYVPPPAPTVEVGKPVSREVTEYFEFTGNTQAVDTVDLRARVQGFLRKVAYQDGAEVKKGQLLFLIEPDQYEAKARSAQSTLASQQAELSRAETEAVRAKKLFAEKAGPETDVVKWESQRDSTKAAVEGAKAQLDLAKIDLGYTRVLAPFDGRVSRRQVDVGNLVGSGGENTLLATIISDDPVYVYFNLNERDLLSIMRRNADQTKEKADPEERVKLEMGLGDNNEYPYHGTMDYYDLGVNPKTGTVLMRGVFPNPDGRIPAGLFARVRIPGKSKKALLAPETAVGLDQTGHYLLLLNDKNIVEQRPVTVGSKYDGLLVVEKGLTGEERIIVSGLQRVRPGSAAKAEEAKPQAPAAKDGAPKTDGAGQ
ncbi:MAG: efflux RND transporter periplasmic adaptor subunit [Desulfovibrionaceae bacterium]|nr:efflux RND transporter periplasmic adaptor subunit [Desulfovibrionaceae bacterium]MBF0513457.1 efflux RND transporter periplasmic adaptor subunit [Desulfovibrionaceae bacterium]